MANSETPKLRRRLHIQTSPQLASDEEFISSKGKQPADENVVMSQDSHGPHHSPLSEDFLSDSDSSISPGPFTSRNNVDTRKSTEQQSPPPPTRIEHVRRPSTSQPLDESPILRSSWYEFDLSVVVALVSPIGNWLTGGDHVKNLLLLLLLIFYLHQIIEIPWALYNLARPRRRALPHVPEPTDAEARYVAVAHSELRVFEFFFLSLTVLSPLMGAFILRYLAASITGTDVVSWFSTTLFILATGIRPWKHVVDRFRQRTLDLHDVIHYPPSSVSALNEDAQARLDDALQRMADLETVMNKLQAQMAAVTEEVYDYVDDAMDGVEKVVKRHEKKCDATRATQEMHLAAVEASVESLESTMSAAGVGRGDNTEKVHPASALSEWLLSYLPSPFSGVAALYPASTNRHRSPSGSFHRSASSGSSSQCSSKTPSTSSKHRNFSSPPRLETIPEDVDFSFIDGPPSHTNLHSHSHTFGERSRPLLRIPGVNLVLRCGDLATLPLRTVVQYLLSPRVYASRIDAS